MTFANEGPADRATRMLAGILLLSGASASFIHGSIAVVLLVLGAIALATGLAGWCPAYTVFGISTKKIVEPHCPHCEPGRQ